jgi:WD40 repeat protein
MTASVIIGTLIGDLFTGWPGRSSDSDIGAVLYGALLSARSYVGSTATAGAVVAIPSVIIGGLTLLSFAWPRFALANAARFFGNLPRGLPAFLADATRRGILRQSGSTYQFRHVRLQESLVRSAYATDLLSSVRARRRRIVNRVGMVTGVLIILTAVLLVPHALRKDTGLALPADNVIDVRWSRDGRTLLTASAWGTSSVFTIRGWSSQSGREVGRAILASAWATDSVTGAFATVSPSAKKDVGHVTIWSRDGQLLVDVGQVSDLEFSPRGGTFATYDNGRKDVQLWDERTGVMSGRKFTDVFAATYSPNGEALVTIDNGLNAHLWDPQSGGIVSSLPRDLGHSSADNVRERSLAAPYLLAPPKITPFDEIGSRPPFNSPEYSLEGTMRGTLVVGPTGLAALEVSDPNSVPLSDDRTPSNLNLWDLYSNQPVAGSPLNRVADWSFDRAGNLKARADLHIQSHTDGSFNNSYYFAVWQSDQRKFAPFLEASSSGVVATTDIVLINGDAPQTSKMISARTGQDMSADFPSQSVYIPNNGCCIVVLTSDYQVDIRDLHNGNLISSITSTAPQAIQLAQYLYDSFTSVEFSPDSTTFIANKAGAGATLYRLKDGRPLVHVDNAINWRFQDTGDLVAIITNQASIELVSSSTGRKVASLTGHTGFVAGVWFTPQGDALASAASDGTVRVWQIRQ